ncbi:MAG: ATP-binding cassette domain-containing protein [Acidimicrobiales bacterium]
MVGPSGSGKSTFLRLVNKQEDPDAGRIFVAGKDIGKPRTGRFRCCAATSVVSSRTSSCCRTRRSART